MVGRHVEVTGLGRVVRRLFRNVVRSLVAIEVPITGENFAENRIQRFLDASVQRISKAERFFLVSFSLPSFLRSFCLFFFIYSSPLQQRVFVWLGPTDEGRMCHPLR